MKNKPYEQYKERLKKIIGTKFNTATIYPLSQFETAFGHLWGHGKKETSLSEEEKMHRQKWDECRKNILDNGHRQRRNTNAELDMHQVEWLRYNATFTPINKEGDKGGS